ncbi:MAG TPA: prolipoprotein diacylglyceryl transferase family protein [Myxococcaceae bacterium]|nr:prolipoprotein diacylglyceryl transferase family protein [Myxococcaceae bacterium]
MRTHALSSPAAAGAAFRRLGVIAGYVLVFAVGVPLQVWSLGGRLDALLRLPTVDTLRAPGRVLLAGGAALWLSAHIWFSASSRGLPISSLPAPRLVTSGPYAWIRHPIYLGFTVALAGLGCAVGSPGHGLLAPFILGTACWAYVVSFEGPALRRRYGATYRRVGRITAGLRLWRGDWAGLRGVLERLANRAVLFRIGPTVWVTYGLFVALGTSVVALLGHVALGGLCSSRQYVVYAFGLAVAMALGARLASLVYNFAALRRRGLVELRTVGFVSWGGYLGMLVFTAAFGAATGIHLLAILDRLLPLLFVCMAFGRVGCLTYGCCFGRPSPGGLRWTDPDAKAVRLLGAEIGSLPRFPVQLVAAGVGLGAAALTWTIGRFDGAVGTPTLFAVLWYCLVRLGVEQLRDEPRLGPLGWTRGQWLAAGVAGLSLVSLMRLDPNVTVTAARGSLDLLAPRTAAGVGLLAFVIFGLHWRRVGRW